jgi:hypothetical protein
MLTLIHSQGLTFIEGRLYEDQILHHNHLIFVEGILTYNH